MEQIETLQITVPQNIDFLITIYVKFLEFLVTSPALGTLIVVMFFVAVFAAMALTAITIRVKHQTDTSRGTEMALAEMVATLSNMSEAIGNINAQIMALHAILSERCTRDITNSFLLSQSKDQ